METEEICSQKSFHEELASMKEQIADILLRKPDLTPHCTVLCMHASCCSTAKLVLPSSVLLLLLQHWYCALVLPLGNRSRDQDKDFETSYTRLLFIMCVTYATLFVYMTLIAAPSPALSAVVPAVGFNLSTLSLPWVKRIWTCLREGRTELKPIGGASSADDDSVV
jgi:hypothetical protein